MRYGPRYQTNLQLVYVFQGTTTLSIDGKHSYTIDAGEVILLYPGHMESFLFAEDTHHGWCYAFLTENHQDLINENWSDQRVIPFTDTMMRIDQTIKASDTHRLQRGSASRDMLINALFYEYLQDSGLLSHPSRGIHPALEKADRILHTDYNEPLTLSDIAQQAGLSEAHLIRLYKSTYGMTPIKRLWDIRLKEAAQLLKETGLTTYEISYRCGFTNPQHFSKAFTRNFGMTPRKYRLKSWETAT
ncbi:MAG: AraC family transcriptional regulator [Verrucomicrobiota bacterium]